MFRQNASQLETHFKSAIICIFCFLRLSFIMGNGMTKLPQNKKAGQRFSKTPPGFDPYADPYHGRSSHHPLTYNNFDDKLKLNIVRLAGFCWYRVVQAEIALRQFESFTRCQRKRLEGKPQVFFFMWFCRIRTLTIL